MISLRYLLTALSLINAANLLAQEPQLLWGDTHLHTTYSPDSYLNQNFTIDPAAAYRFAQGLPVIHPTTKARVQLETPLDFLVVADHAESYGVFRRANEEGLPRDGLGLLESIQSWGVEKALRFLVNDPDSISLLLDYATAATWDVVESAKTTPSLPIPLADQIRSETWALATEAADAANQPGKFSAIIGWEWSSIPAGANLHRVVMTNSNAKTAQNYIPFASSSSNYPEDLWQWLGQTAAKTGADFIAIPHNSNISRGFMFPTEKRLRGTDIDVDWLSLRAKWEVAVEITQVKGDSEAHPDLSPGDQFADFENFPHYLKPGAPAYKAERGDFVRNALLSGLELEQKLGQNPYKMGIIGSTDSHTGLATAEEPNFWGKMATDSVPADKSDSSGGIEKLGWAMSASGLAAVWAKDNSRQSIFDAFRRREVYGTTGPRIAVRLYAGTDFKTGDENTMTMAEASTLGVPMGGELSGLNSAPSFLVHAAKDPKSAHLDRLQMVKGWLENGQLKEKVYDIAWSGDRQPRPNGDIAAVTDTVNPTAGTYDNSHGAIQLATVWSDPAFDPTQAAFYYVRVLEIPTPRHSTLDAIALGINPESTGQAVSIQERAYTSPVYYAP